MATNYFIPQVWSAKILEALDKELVYAGRIIKIVKRE